MMRPSLLLLACGAALWLFDVPAPLQGQEPPVITSAPLSTSAETDAPPAADLPPGSRSLRNANYEIDAQLDHDARTLSGREIIRWRNVTSQPTSELRFHLYWNAWRNAESTWLRERRLSGQYRAPRNDAWGSTDVTRLRVRDQAGEWQDLTSAIRFVAPDDGNQDDRTVMTVPLAWAVAAEESLEIEVEWTSRVPRPFARTGYIANYYFIAHWFPKLGVLEEDGWNAHQFHAATEFFSDFGVYDVRLRVPAAFVIGASGREVAREPSADGTVTHHYRGEDIHDFAWTASPDFIDLTERFEHPALPPVELRLLLQPERRAQAGRYFAIVRATLEKYGLWFGPYPYGHLTIVDPAFQSQSDGMEYPTLITGRARWLAPSNVQVPEATTSHEVGHQWWYGMVATNEFEHAWMDEGLTTYATARVLDEFFEDNRVELRLFGGFVPWALRDIPFTRLDNDRLAGYRLNAEADPPWTPTFRYWPATATFISYNKTALWLHTLERRVGWPVMQKILSTYFETWKFRHPTPADFFDVVREVSGQGHVAFFDEVYRTSNTFDYGVQEFRTERFGDRYRTSVVIGRFGEALHPVDVVTTFEDGQQARETWDGRDRRVIYVYERPAAGFSVQVDPDHELLLDIARTNNSRTLQPRSSQASLKWSAQWMLWLQDLMLTYAFFV